MLRRVEQVHVALILFYFKKTKKPTSDHLYLSPRAKVKVRRLNLNPAFFLFLFFFDVLA